MAKSSSFTSIKLREYNEAERGRVWEYSALTRTTKNKSIMKALAQVKGWLQIWTGKNEIEVELSGSERVQQVAVEGITVPCLAYVGESCVSVCAFNDGDANALLR